MNHSPEPWKYDTDWHRFQDADEATIICTAADEEVSPSLEDAARIVACVNFCRGIPTEELLNSVPTMITSKRLAGQP